MSAQNFSVSPPVRMKLVNLCAMSYWQEMPGGTADRKKEQSRIIVSRKRLAGF
jgi:hypothetical protein